MELQYKIKVFTIQSFSNFIRNYDKQSLELTIHYFNYNNIRTWGASETYINSTRFIVAYNKNTILGISKVSIYDNTNNHISISYLSVHYSYTNKGISKRLVEETVKVCKEFNIPIGTSQYSVEGWKYVRKYLLEYCMRYNVELIDNYVGYPGRNLDHNEEFYALIKESKKIYLEKYPEKSNQYLW